ncbi:MAG: hypothetical protein R6X05_18415 [Desulfobacterales bacterium]
MNRILLATVNRARLKEFAEALAADPEVRIAWADFGAAALADVMTHPPLAVIVDATLPGMEGLELVRRLLPINAMIYTAVISELPADRFHEVREGLGVLGQLPPRGRPRRRQLSFSAGSSASPRASSPQREPPRTCRRPRAVTGRKKGHRGSRPGGLFVSNKNLRERGIRLAPACSGPGT